MEAAMGFLNLGHIFKPLDLEILDRVYEAAWAHIEARDLYRDPQKAGGGSCYEDGVHGCRYWSGRFDTLCDKVLASLTPRPEA
jgi:hypothetical protein